LRLGVWLGKDETANRIELQQALSLAKTYADIIDVIIVGNEVLLRQDLTREALRAHLQYAKANTHLPITYADVWEFWRVNASLKNDVDLVTVHILPYWEDEPVSATMATDHVFDTLRAMQYIFVGKPVWIGETGWPSAGRQRAGANPGLVEQTQVIRELVSRARNEQSEINIIEGFDQPWKRALEGAMGGAWGLFNAEGHQKIGLQGAVVEDENWLRGLWGSAIGAISFTVIALVWNALGRTPHQTLLLSCFSGAIIGGFVPLQIDYLVLWNRDAREWFFGLFGAAVIAVGTVTLLMVLWHSIDIKLKQVTRRAKFGFYFVAASWALNLLFDSRYRGFPIAIFAPAAIFSLCQLAQQQRFNLLHRLFFEAPPTSTQFLGYVLALTAIAIAISEGPSNFQAIALSLCWVVIAIPAISQAGPDSSTL
jgi:hypothetical protein